MEDESVDQDPLPDLERRLHRAGWDLIRLDHEGLDQESKADRNRDDDDQFDEAAAGSLRLRDERAQASSPSSPASS
jgi:hypothetical protein